MKRLILTLAMALFVVVSFAQVNFVSTTFEKAQAMGRKAGKELLIDVTMGDKASPEIAKLFKDRALANYINKNFIAVRINMSNKDNRSFGNHLYSLMYPCVAFYTNRGEQLESSNWYTIGKNKGKLNEMAKVSLEKAAVKRNNSRRIEFRDLDFKQALEVAKKENKLVFIDTYTDWCRPCKQMDNDVFTLNAVADYYNDNFVCIKLNADKEPHNVAKTYGVRGYPAYLYIAHDGALVSSEGGYTPEQKFIAFGVNAKASYEKNKEIIFDNLSLNEAIAKAKSEGKQLFINISATWCGPCKMVKATTFKEPKVGVYHNKNFVNIYVETDKDKAFGEELKAKYGYGAFPTFVYADANGNLTHKFVGAGFSGSEFLRQSEMGLKNSGLVSFDKRYEAGERDVKFMKEYIDILSAAYDSEKTERIATEYFSSLPVEKLLEKETFDVVKETVKDLDAKPVQLFLENYDKFFEKFGIEAKVYRSIVWHLKSRSYVDDNKPFDKAGYKAYRKRLKAADIPEDLRTDIIKMSELHNAEKTSNWKEFTKVCMTYMKKAGANYPINTLSSEMAKVNRFCEDAKVRVKYADFVDKMFPAIQEREIERKKEIAKKYPASGSVMAMSMGGDPMKNIESLIIKLKENN